GLDRARPLPLRRPPLRDQLRQSLAASLSEPASADLDSVAGLDYDDPMGGEDALHLLPDPLADRRGRALLPGLSRRGGKDRLHRDARSTCLLELDLCLPDRRQGDEGGKASS